MLSELRDLLENAQPGNQASNSQSQEMMQMLDGLSELISKQQQLLDETFRAQQESEYGSPGEEGEPGDEAREGREGREGKQGRQGQQGQGSKVAGQGKSGQGKSGQGEGRGENPFPGLGQQQGDLQKQLKELMDQLKGFGAKPPEQFDGAGQAMGKAGDALGQENAGRATEQQTLALDKMRQGAKSLVEQMMSGMGQPGNQGRGQAGAGDRDPLGRPLPTQGLDNGDSVKVPEESRHSARPADIGRAAPPSRRARPAPRRAGLYRAADRAVLTAVAPRRSADGASASPALESDRGTNPLASRAKARLRFAHAILGLLWPLAAMDRDRLPCQAGPRLGQRHVRVAGSTSSPSRRLTGCGRTPARSG